MMATIGLHKLPFMGMQILKRHKAFIVPLTWLVVSGIFLWRALHDSQLSSYLAALAFAGVALMFYLGLKDYHPAENTRQ